MDRGKLNKFMDYFSKPLSIEQITYLNTINNISSERVDLFRDFTLSLTHLINDTYLGDDTITTHEDQVNHFNWCWDKNINNFAKENIYLQSKGEHYYYYLTYFTDFYYTDDKKTDASFDKLLNFWDETISMELPKTKSDYDLFAEILNVMGKYFLNNH